MGVEFFSALIRKGNMHKRILTKDGWRSQYVIDRNNKLKKEHKLFYDNLKYKNNKYQIVKKFLREQDVCYIYFLFYFNNLVYIGKSVNPDSRITSHGFKHNLVRKIKTTNLLAEKWEKKLIEKYQPVHNKSGIKYFRVEHRTNRGCTFVNVKIRVRKKNKIKLNLKFNKNIISNEIYKGKDSSYYHVSFNEFVKDYPSKYYCVYGKKIIFFTYKPNKFYYPNAKLITKNVIL